MNDNLEIEKTYMEYLGKANEVFKIQQKVYLPYAVSGLLLFGIGGSAFFWASPQNALWMFSAGLVTGIVDTTVGTLTARKKVLAEANAVETSLKLPGFSEFFKLFYHRRWWPNQMVTGEKYQQFLSIIGRN
ncbi:MAG: hypothetical protein FJZ86_12430 [Chloroflexi bacterium]|nr:hypothetical protein [Chloroflexota bacterium]